MLNDKLSQSHWNDKEIRRELATLNMRVRDLQERLAYRTDRRKPPAPGRTSSAVSPGGTTGAGGGAPGGSRTAACELKDIVFPFIWPNCAAD